MKIRQDMQFCESINSYKDMMTSNITQSTYPQKARMPSKPTYSNMYTASIWLGRVKVPSEETSENRCNAPKTE